ncbi:protein-disulfide reductase DsbD family protein [Polaromonas hydrogenivorans]|uniref:Thioredoxin family protein n=1 Tax=Polaromonas hydrogenivorans TaxID=335476 RepID=A0AAU7LSK3_9BURK
MNFHRLLSALFLIAACALPASANTPNDLIKTSQARPVVTTEQVRAELLAWAPEGVEPGKPVWLGLQLAHQPEWHTYWKNSGDSGLPTMLEWQLPAGVTAGEIAWPTPRKIPIGTLANYGYEGTMLLPVPLTVAPGFSAAQLDVKLKAAWLVCRKECIPQEGEFTLSLPARGSTAASGALFQAAFDATPKPLPTGSSQIEVSGKALKVSLAGLPAALQGKTLALFPETASIIEPAAPWQQAWAGALWTAELPLSAQRTDSPARLPLVVAFDAAAWRIDAPVSGDWPAAASVAVVSPALQAALRANAATTPPASSGQPPLSLLAALLGALLGGLILNLMPCVFPVLAIKVVGFASQKSQAARLTSGLAYSAGVVLSFLALGALLLGLRAAGDQLGWGFQLQNPAVVAALAALFTLLGLNLAGLFDFGVMLPSRVVNLQAKNPSVNAFLSGVLATAIASPCTAPFMGASLGYAVGLPALQALAVFGAIGIGMALPYLAASALPAVARALPRPGAWMVTFKQLMAFPMFATVAWLVWVLGQQSGIDGAGALLALLVLLALAVWSFSLRGTARRAIATVSVALCAFAIWAIGPNIIKPVIPPVASASARWQDWQPGRVEQLAAQGQSVFVDFTAAWCVTCQYNKKTTLADAAVLADMDAKNVALLRADWTRRDPAVTKALAALGRSGVPVYVFYKPGRAPVVLSEILSVSDVRAELARL